METSGFFFRITNVSANRGENVKKNYGVDIYQILRKVIVSSILYKLQESSNKKVIEAKALPWPVMGWKWDSKHLQWDAIRHRVTTLETREYVTPPPPPPTPPPLLPVWFLSGIAHFHFCWFSETQVCRITNMRRYESAVAPQFWHP